VDALSEWVEQGRLPHGVSIISFSYELGAATTPLWELLRLRKLPTQAVVCGPLTDETLAAETRLSATRLSELRQGSERAQHEP
jgi:hypothetical protein